MIGGELLEMNDMRWGKSVWSKSTRAWMVKICSWSAIFIRTAFFFFSYGLPDIMDDVRFDRNEICSESTNFCGFLTFSFSFISFVVSG